MLLPRRRLITLAATSLAVAPWTVPFVQHARAADVPRFSLGVASGQPRADRVVLWTRLTGADLEPQVEVNWELARDAGFRDIVARGSEPAEADWAHSVHAEPAGLAPGREYFYRFTALGQRSAVGRTRTAPAADQSARLEFVIASCQRYDAGHYAAWRDVAEHPPDLVMFLGDYIYEYASRPDALRSHEPIAGGAPLVTTLDQYRARYATYRSDPHLQAAHAACPWLMVWDDHEVDNDYAGLQGAALQPDFARQRAAAYQAYWEHMPFAKADRPRGSDMPITGRLDWGRLARIHLLDSRQHRDPQACPKPRSGGSNTVRAADCAALRDPSRSLLGLPQERWLADGWDLHRPWNLVAQQTLMARFSWTDPSDGGTVWTDGWDGYAPARQRLLEGIAERRLGGAVVLGGDVHTHYVTALKTDFDDDRAPSVATEFCGTSISSRSLAQSRIDAARAFNPHVQFARGDHRGTVRFVLDERRLLARLMAVADASKPDSAVDVMASFVVEAGRPGAQPA